MKTKLLLAFTLLAAPVAIFAASAPVSDIWNQSGGAWNSDSGVQPQWQTNHIILSNARDAELHSSIGPAILPTEWHMWGHYFYTASSSGNFTLTPSVVADDLGMIILAVIHTGHFSSDPVLNYGAQTGLSANSVVLSTPNESIVIEEPEEGVEYNTTMQVFTWVIEEPDPEALFTISFSFPAHVAFSNIVMTQQVVPEPATYALFAGAAVLCVAWVVRRRRK